MQLIANWWFGIHDVAQEDIENIHCILASEKKTFNPHKKHAEPNLKNKISYAITALYQDKMKMEV